MKNLKFFPLALLQILCYTMLFLSCEVESEPAYYTVTFYSNYAGASTPSTSRSYEEGCEIYLNPIVKREKYTLLGWSVTADAVTPDYAAGTKMHITSNLSLYAVWQKTTQFIVTYNANFGSDPATKMQVVNISSENERFLLEKNTFVRTGHVLIGWSKEQDALSNSGGLYKNEESVKYFYEDTTLYAVWLAEEKSIKITYRNEKANPTEEKVCYTEKGRSFNLNANTFTLEGMTFGGWATSPASKKKVYADEEYVWSSKAENDITLYALWHDDKNYIITYHSNFTGPSYDYKEQVVEKTDTKVNTTLEKNMFKRDGYVFYGWYIEPSLPTSYFSSTAGFYTDESKITLSEDKELYALWLEDNSTSAVKLIYNKNDGSDAASEETQYVKYGKKNYSSMESNFNKLRYNTFTRENYEFIGWAASPTAIAATYKDGQSDVCFTADTTLYAVWLYNGPVTITFDANGGSDPSGNTTSCQLIMGNTRTALNANTFTRQDYTFTGWVKTAETPSKYYRDKESVIFTESQVLLCAVWKANPVITFDGCGGLTSDGSDTTTQIVIPGKDTVLNANPFIKEGSTFDGWTARSPYRTYKDCGSISVEADTVLYANWWDDITLILKANGGTGSDVEQTVKYNVEKSCYSFTAPRDTFTRDDYTLVGWSEKAYSKSAAYKAGEESSIKSDVRILYAVWAKTIVPVTFAPNTKNSESGTEFTRNLVIDAESLNYEADMPENSFTNSNGVFVGWSTEQCPNEESVIMKAGEHISLPAGKLPNSDGFTIYAIWNLLTYTITYDMGGNGENIVRTVTNTAEYGQKTSYVLEGGGESKYDYYTFIGWAKYKEAYSASFKKGDAVLLNDDETFYAVWELGTVRENTWKNISSNSKIHIPFTLLKTETLSISAEANGTLYFYCMTEDSGKKWYSDSAFSYYKNVSAPEGTTAVSGTVLLEKGTYWYGIQNKNVLSSKNYTVTIKKYGSIQ